MCPLYREQLVVRRAARRRSALRRDRRAIVSAAIPVLVVAVLALVLGVTGGSEPTGPLASPVPELGSGAQPPELVIARGDAVEVHIPVDPGRVTAAVFHAINDPSGVAMAAGSGLDIHQADRDGRAGPDTAGLDVGAPAGTAVYAPVDGTVASVSEYQVLGRIEGYEVTIAPTVASSGLVLRLTHLDPPAAGDLPSVGTPVRAGVTPLGRIRDFSAVVDQELADFTADSGNHVHMELIRTEAGLLP